MNQNLKVMKTKLMNYYIKKEKFKTIKIKLIRIINLINKIKIK